MAEYRLAYRVGEVADRLHQLRTLRRRSRLCSCGVAIGLLLLGGNFWLPTPLLSFPITLGVGVLLLLLIWVASRRPSPTLQEAAVSIEERWPDLDSRLVTSIDQHPDDDAGGFHFLQHEVISEALVHAHRHDWRDTVSLRVLSRAKLQQLLSGMLFVGVFAAAAWTAHAKPNRPVASIAQTGDSLAKYPVTIEPGDAVIERGTSLLVIARFADRVPTEAILHATDASGITTELPLSRSLDDPLFGGRLPEVNTDLSYHLTFDGEPSKAYQIRVFDFPQLEQADATIVHPDYTGLGMKSMQDVRRVSVVEGSTLTLSCLLNKPVETAVLRDQEGMELPLDVVSGRAATVRQLTFEPRENRTFELILIDAEGRTNKQPPQFVVDVIPNQPPELAVDFPGKDIRVSPLEEVSLEANARDDFGLKEYGLIYQLPAHEEQSLKLGEGSGQEDEAAVVLAHQLAMEDLAAEPNEVVSYYFYADDIGPDGNLRRTFSDMYFAEVRYFDEEYRQARSSQAPSGNMPGGNSPSSQLLQLQREIVNATWNLIRRERDDQPSDAFPEDVRTVIESQQAAIAMGQKLQSLQEDAVAKQHLAEALEHMAAADDLLSKAATAPSIAPLSSARKAEYAAFQSLVKLNVREHLVQQAQASAQGQSSASQSDLNRQLQQLQLQNDRNRYETEQQDQPSTDREQLQVLNRLRELARRQEGLNEKIQELENALRDAESAAEREEIERQLKRLQEEQQQMLRDLDELQQRMNKEQNRSRMADAREQAEDVRENLRRSSEALKQGQTSQALAAGTRAERQLNQMKDELREKTAGQFADSMRQLRQQAQQLAETQQQLANDLQGNTERGDAGPPRLKDDETNQLNEQFDRQREQLAKLMEEVKQVVVESESSEPLLSKTLYDAVRETRTDRPEESLEMASQFLRHGLREEAARAEAQARTGIDKLREGIDEAADRVLGNETESLRRARDEIDDLSRAVASELQQTEASTSSQEEQRLDPHEGSPTEQVESPSIESERDALNPSGQQSPHELASQADRSRQHQRGSSPDETELQPHGQPGASAESGSLARQRDGQRADQQQGGLLEFLRSETTDNGGASTGPGGLAQPLTGTDFVHWSDGMRDVEEMIGDPDLRARVAQIRDRAKQMRIDLKRRSRVPKQELIRTEIYGPLLELRERLSEEIARREPAEKVVPLDRDPVPDRYAELVERYYERLGSGR